MKSSTSDFLTDVQTVNIIIKQIGPNRALPAFKRIVERCTRQNVIQVSENPRRLFHCAFLPSVSFTEYSELQQHRRVFAVIGVAFTSDFSQLEKLGSQRVSRDSVDGDCLESEQIAKSYRNLKSEHSSSILSSRCILMGAEQDDCIEIERRERLCYTSLDDASNLESAIRELMREIYIVLESKRVDISFEKKQEIPCPTLPDEARWQFGVETKTAKLYKKKCLGRCRKQHADFCLLTGLPQLALEAYEAAIENLRAAQDHLWLAAAYDGYASTFSILNAEQMGEINIGVFHRVASMHVFTVPSIEINTLGVENLSVSNDSMLSSPQGHKRHHSDENVRSNSSLSNGTEKNESFGNESGIVSNGSTPSLKEDSAKMKSSKNLNPISNFLDKTREKPSKEKILEYFKNAIEEFAKFTFAGWLEYEAVMRAIVYLTFEREYVKLEQFHRDYTGKYLDDLNTFMDHHMKAQICLNSAAMYKEIGFLRKQSFYARLSVLFELHVTEGRQRSASDYKNVYPILFKTLEGYGINLNESQNLNNKKLGPEKLQIKCLHEIFTAANRAGHRDAAIRHLCFLLQVYFNYLEPSMAVRLFDDLDNLVKSSPNVHQLNQTLVVDEGRIIIPSLQLSRFPLIQNPTVLPLQSHLAPTIVPHNTQSSIFIYSPFAPKKSDDAILWVTDCPGEVEITVKNSRGAELTVRDLCLIVEGVSFEAVQARLILPPEDHPSSDEGATIRLLGVPREPGKLYITGYSCNVFGLHNECRFLSQHNHKTNKILVNVLPKLAKVHLECSLPRAPIDENNEEPSAEAVVYSGQKFDHTVTVVNDSNISVRYCGVKIWQPTVQGGPPLIALEANDQMDGLSVAEINEDLTSFSLEPHTSKLLKFHIFGIDPTSTADDLSDEEKVLESVVPLATTQAVPNPELESSDMDLIPYTGRLLTCDFTVRYHSDIETDNGDTYERKCKLPIAISIIPAVTVSAWHVLPGDSPLSRYIVVDVTNSTEHDAELVYSSSRRMNVLPKETCRVPILSPCCSDVAGGAFHQAKQRGSHMMQKIETERLRQILEAHVSKHLDIRWAIPALRLDGQVPVGSLLSSVSLLKQLVLPAISLDFVINGKQYVSEDDVTIGIGQIVDVEVIIISSLPDSFKGILSLECEQEISRQLGSNSSTHFMLVMGSKRVPFNVKKPNSSSVKFRLNFIVEGSFRVRPQITPAPHQNALLPEDMFATPVAFSVSTKF